MTTHFPFGHKRVTGAQQRPLVQVIENSATPAKNTPSDANSAILSACPRCGQQTKPRSKNVRVCEQCYEELRQEAERQQEAGYLCAWLRSRVDKDGFPFEDSALVATPSDRATALRLVTVARKLNIPWTEPVQQVAFATRMRGLLAPYGGNDGDGGDDDGPDGGEAA